MSSGSIISRSAAQPEHELDKELGTRPFTPPEPQRAQTATVPPTALPRRRLLTALSGRQLTNRHVVVGVIAIALMAVLLLGGMIHRVWFAGLRNDAPSQLAIEARASPPRSRLLDSHCLPVRQRSAPISRLQSYRQSRCSSSMM